MMKRIPYILIFIVVIGIFSLPKSAYAVACTGPGTGSGEPAGCEGSCTGTGGNTSSNGVTWANCRGSTQTWSWKQSNTAVAGSVPTETSKVDDTCGLTNLTGCLMKGVGWIALTIMRLFSLVTLLAGALLNYVILYTVVDMAEHYRNIGAIKISWGMIRDLANMTFIFILLYQAIRTIVGEGKETQKFVVNMIIAALLMNFSFFFTSLVIDASNLITLTFYKAIVSGDVNEANLLQTGLSNAIMKPLNLTSIWDISDNLSGTNLITIGILGSVFTLIAAFVFFAIALLFIIRYVILIFVLILSPIFVVGSIIPGMKTYADKWKDALTGQALFAPVYMIITWVVIKIFNDDNFFNLTSSGTSKPTLGSALSGSLAETRNAAGVVVQSAQTGVQNIGLIMNFIVIIAFLIATIIIAKMVSDKSGSIVSGMNKWAMSKAGSASFGLAGSLGRGTIGRGIQNIADNKNLQAAALKGGIGGMSARLALATAEKGGKASFDIRSSALGGSLEAGKGQSGGFATDRKKREERTKEIAKSVAALTPEEKTASDKAKESFKEENVAKSDAYINAEQELAKAEEDAARQTSGLVDINGNPIGSSPAEKQARVAAAKAKLEEQKKEHAKVVEKAKEEALKTAGQRRIEEAAASRQEGIEKKKKAGPLSFGRWIPSSDRVGLFGSVKKEAEREPGLIRAAAKIKTPEEEAVEALKKVKAEADKKPTEGNEPKKESEEPKKT